MLVGAGLLTDGKANTTCSTCCDVLICDRRRPLGVTMATNDHLALYVRS